MAKYNARACFSIGTNFSEAEFAAVEERAQEYAGDSAITNAHYAAAANDILTETQSLLDKLLSRLDYEYPSPSILTVSPVAEVEPEPVDPEQEFIRYSRALSESPVTKTQNFKNWFRDSEIKYADGTPKVMYRGTARDEGVVKQGQGNAIFLTDNPKFAEDFAYMSQSRAEERVMMDMDPETVPPISELNLQSYANIQPLFVRAEYVFDYENSQHIEDLEQLLRDRHGTTMVTNAKKDPMIISEVISRIKEGSWRVIESPDVQDSIRDLGHDGYYVEEAEEKNLAVYDSNQIKSATGNNGDFSDENPDIRYSRSQTETPEFKRWFGDSKVVDTEGKPLVVYHGAKWDIEDGIFRMEKGMLGTGAYFTSNPQEADFYTSNAAWRTDANIVPAYVSIENPYYAKDKWDKGALKAKENGHDGVILLAPDGKSVEWAIPFSPTQIKSAIGNNGQFDPTNPDIRYSRPTSVYEALEQVRSGKRNYTPLDALSRYHFGDAFMGAKDAVQRKKALRQLGDSVIENIVDSLIPVRRWIEGLNINENLKQRLTGDLYRADTVRSNLQKDVTSQFTQKMYAAIDKAAAAKSMTTDQVKQWAGIWMSARYAQRANLHLITKDRVALREAFAVADANKDKVTGLYTLQDQAKISEAQQNLNDRLSDVHGPIRGKDVPAKRGLAGGFNNAEAAAMVAEIEQQIDKQLLEDIAKPMYDMLEWKKQMDVANGKVTQTMVNSWPNDPLYVPLTGDPRYNGETDDIFNSGNQVNQDKEHAMNGRKESMSEDGIDAALTAVIKSINHAAMQDFKRSLNAAYNEAQASGQDIGIERADLTGIVRTGDDVVIYRDTAVKNGVESTKATVFRFADRAVMDALKKNNQENLNAFFKIIGAGTSLYGRAVTQFMPMFAPINFLRDIWERSEVIRIKKLLDQSGVAVNMDKVARRSLAESANPQLWKATFMKNFKRGGMNPVRGDLEELVRLGGMSSWGDYLSRSGSDIEADIRAKSGVTGRTLEKVKEFAESYNNSFEMVPSLAIYRALKAEGVAPKDAAAAVLDLMNFRKKGAIMPAVRSLYVFAQPAAQSGYNLAQYLSTTKGRARFTAQLLISVGLYALLRAAWGDEDDEELGNKLDNLPNYTVERSIPLQIGDKVVKVPVGFGPPQLAWAMGGVINRFASGRYTAVDALGEAAKGWAKSFAPVSPSDMELSKRPIDFLAQTFTPTLAKPFANIYADQNSFGGPLTPQFKDKDKMRFEQAMRQTPKFYSDVAKEIYNITGVDMFPDHVKALMDGYLVGPFREMTSLAISNPSKVERGEPERIPLIAQLVDNINDRQHLGSIYYRYRNDLEKAHTKLEYLKRTDPAQITPELRDQARAFAEFSTADKMIGIQRSALRKNKSMSDEARAARLQEIEARADASHKRVLIKYLQSQES